jgi:hypothetical protein
MEDDDDMGDELDEELDDITESVLDELEKIAMPNGSTEGKEIGSGGKTVSGSTNKTGMLPKHNVNDRIDGAKPYLVKGGNNDSFERETAPPRKGVDTLVKGVRKGNVRGSFKDTMKTVPSDGDSSAALNKNFAGGEPKSASPVDGKAAMRPKTR